MRPRLAPLSSWARKLMLLPAAKKDRQQCVESLLQRLLQQEACF